MFTESWLPDDVSRFESFIGAHVLRAELVPLGALREDYFLVPPNANRVFVDPNTGIRLEPIGGARSRAFIFARELVGLCAADPARLVVAFDQSHPRGAEQESLQGKMAHFRREGLSGFAYRSHASFVVLSAAESAVDTARRRLLALGLPGDRIAEA